MCHERKIMFFRGYLVIVMYGPFKGDFFFFFPLQDKL